MSAPYSGRNLNLTHLSRGRIAAVSKETITAKPNYRTIPDALVRRCCEPNTEVSNLLVAYAVTELYGRMLKLQPATYEKAVAAYKTELITFAVPGAKEAQLKLLNPVLENRMKDYKRSNV